MALWPKLSRDFRRFREGKGWSVPRGLYEGVLLDAGFQALVAHRMAHTSRRWRIPVLPAVLRRLAAAFCGVDILPQAEIGGGCVLVHALGIVIGGRSVIGEDCVLLHGVTLGEVRFEEDTCPRVGDRVVIGAGATLLGGITIGDDAKIAAGAVVLDDVPPGHVAVGVPATSRPAAKSIR
jgi:serine O-acetyltransferase